MIIILSTKDEKQNGQQNGHPQAMQKQWALLYEHKTLK